MEGWKDSNNGLGLYFGWLVFQRPLLHFRFGFFCVDAAATQECLGVLGFDGWEKLVFGLRHVHATPGPFELGEGKQGTH